MSRAGRKKDPIPFQILKGKRKAGASPGIKFPKDGLSTPRHLSKGARKEWRRMKPVLLAAGLLTMGDRAAFAMYCESWARWEILNEYINGLIKDMGSGALLLTTPNGALQQNPLVGIQNRSLDQARALLAEFGLSPVSRARLIGDLEEEEEDDGILDT